MSGNNIDILYMDIKDTSGWQTIKFSAQVIIIIFIIWTFIHYEKSTSVEDYTPLKFPLLSDIYKRPNQSIQSNQLNEQYEPDEQYEPNEKTAENSINALFIDEQYNRYSAEQSLVDHFANEMEIPSYTIHPPIEPKKVNLYTGMHGDVPVYFYNDGDNANIKSEQWRGTDGKIDGVYVPNARTYWVKTNTI